MSMELHYPLADCQSGISAFRKIKKKEKTRKPKTQKGLKQRKREREREVQV